MSEFDGEIYWRERLAKYPDLQGTGLYSLPLPWQRWLYRGKERAYLRLLKRAGLDIRGCQILNFGCGTGYFETFWESLGAHRADGLDIVPELIDRLQREHPDRKYLCADISKDSSKLAVFGSPRLITAIDILYHIVDDDALMRTLRALTSIIPPDGYFLFTEAFNEKSTAPHVHFRSLDQWLKILPEVGLEFKDKEPVFAINDRVLRGVGRIPGVLGALQHFIDFPVLRLFPWTAKNWAVLAQRLHE